MSLTKHGSIPLFTALLLTGLTTSVAGAQVKLVNLSDTGADVAIVEFLPGRNQVPTGASKLAFVPEDQWRYRGWYSVPAGGTLDMPVGSFRVLQKGNVLTWPNRPTINGLVKNAGFNVSITATRGNEEYQQLVREGFRSEQFQTLDAGTWTISGNAYRMASKDFPFAFTSLNIKLHTSEFHVPGPIVRIEQHVSDNFSCLGGSVTQNGSTARMSVTTVGKKPANPFGAREAGRYKGSLKIHYIERN